MTAHVRRDPQSGFYRAVCKDEACRADNAQRNYWRTPHLNQHNAQREADEHNALSHPAQPTTGGTA